MSDSDFAYRAQVLAFDPAPLLAQLAARGKIQPFKRRQDLSVDDVLPSQPAGLCACGCGEKIVLPRRKWASSECPWFGYAIQGILLGDTLEIGRWLKRQCLAAGNPIGCAHCGATKCAFEVDHKLAVALGGGGRWLDNYQLLCHVCHLVKTASDKKLIAAYRKSILQNRLSNDSLRISANSL